MYKDIDDYEILYMIKEGNDYYEIMLNKYKPLIITICEKYQGVLKKCGYEMDDIIQIANMAFVDAIDAYQEKKDVLFYTFCCQCIKNRLKNELRNQQTNKRITLNKVISYNTIIDGQELINYLPDNNIKEPIEELMLEELEIKYINFINSLPFDVAVVYELKQNGFSNKEISTLVELDIKTITKYIGMANRKLSVQN